MVKQVLDFLNTFGPFGPVILALIDFFGRAQSEHDAVLKLRNQLIKTIRFQVASDLAKEIPDDQGITASRSDNQARGRDKFNEYLGSKSQPMLDLQKCHTIYDSYILFFRTCKYSCIPFTAIWAWLVLRLSVTPGTPMLYKALAYLSTYIFLAVPIGAFLFRAYRKEQFQTLCAEYEVP